MKKFIVSGLLLVLSLAMSCAHEAPQDFFQRQVAQVSKEDCQKIMESSCARAQFYSERVGFGESAQGALGAKIYVVSSAQDGGPGSLREALESAEPLWVVFSEGGVFAINTPIDVKSYKTLDGQGVSVLITGAGLLLRGAQHVVIHNVSLDQGVGDAIELRENSQYVWLHHLSLSRFTDGLVDVVRGSTDVTISASHFSRHDKTVLLGADVADVQDEDLRVTMHDNWFEKTRQRHPRLRYGRVHVFNNYFDNWDSYAVAVSQRGHLYSESNVYQAGVNKRAILKHMGADPKEGFATSEQDLFLNHARPQLRASLSKFLPWEYYVYQVKKPGRDLIEEIKNSAGPR